MLKFKEGDRVKVVSRDVTDEDRKENVYFSHMAGLTGTVENVFGANEIAVKVDPASLSAIPRDVHKIAVERMREKLLEALSEEQKKQLTKEELDFDANYVLLLRSADMEHAG